MFLGYADKYKGYRCVNSNGGVYISRHVRFNELEFPFAQQSSRTLAEAAGHWSSSTLPVSVQPSSINVVNPPPAHSNTLASVRMSDTVPDASSPASESTQGVT